MDEHTLYVPFSEPTYYRAVIRQPPSQMAVFPPGQQLVVLYYGELECTIRHLSDFQGYVTVDSSEKALRYVRLLSDARTRNTNLEEWCGAEILSDHTLSAAKGSVPAELLKRVDWHPAHVQEKGGAWVVERYAVLRRVLPGNDTIVKTVEVVGMDGSYRMENRGVLWSGRIDGVAWESRI